MGSWPPAPLPIGAVGPRLAGVEGCGRLAGPIPNGGKIGVRVAMGGLWEVGWHSPQLVCEVNWGWGRPGEGAVGSWPVVPTRDQGGGLLDLDQAGRGAVGGWRGQLGRQLGWLAAAVCVISTDYSVCFRYSGHSVILVSWLLYIYRLFM